MNVLTPLPAGRRVVQDVYKTLLLQMLDPQAIFKGFSSLSCIFPRLVISVGEKCCQPASGDCRDVQSELPSLCLWDFKGFLCFSKLPFPPRELLSLLKQVLSSVPLQLPIGENPAFLVFFSLSRETAYV